MNSIFLGKMNGLKVPAIFQKFLEDKGVKDEESFALMATDEKEIKTSSESWRSRIE